MGRLHKLAWLPVLLATACGTLSTPSGAPSRADSASRPAAMAAAKQAPATSGAKTAVAVGEGVKTRHAWVRLRQDQYWIRPKDRVRLWLDISSSKPVQDYSADWHASAGRLDRWWTNSPWDWNYWTAPDQEGIYWMRIWVDIRYTDGTSDREWLNEYLRVNKAARPD